MICYDKNDIKDLRNHEDQYYMPSALFDTEHSGAQSKQNKQGREECDCKAYICGAS